MPTPATGDFPENWSGRVPKCGEFCMGRALREVRHCDNFAEPSCFCSLGEDPLPKNSSAFGCISSDCYLTGNEPEPSHFSSLCSEYSETQTESTAKATSQSTTTTDAPSTTTDSEPTIAPTPVSSGPGEHEPDGLPMAAKVAIPIAGTIALLIILALVFRRYFRQWFWTAARKVIDKAQRTTELERGTASDAHPDIKDGPYIAELDVQRTPELESSTAYGPYGAVLAEKDGESPADGDSPAQRHELDGTGLMIASPRVEGRKGKGRRKTVMASGNPMATRSTNRRSNTQSSSSTRGTAQWTPDLQQNDFAVQDAPRIGRHR